MWTQRTWWQRFCDWWLDWWGVLALLLMAAAVVGMFFAVASQPHPANCTHTTGWVGGRYVDVWNCPNQGGR